MTVRAISTVVWPLAVWCVLTYLVGSLRPFYFGLSGLVPLEWDAPAA